MKAWWMMIVGVLISAISGGATALAVSLAHGNGVLLALLSYPLGGDAGDRGICGAEFGPTGCRTHLNVALHL